MNRRKGIIRCPKCQSDILVDFQQLCKESVVVFAGRDDKEQTVVILCKVCYTNFSTRVICE